MAYITLEPRLVKDIKGTFVVPSYQRGYRWGRDEVTRLLDDIYENLGKNYCLQPVVVARRGDGSYELIDGQQRLTTLYLIRQYMHKDSGGFMEAPSFSIRYDTREESETFLDDVDLDNRDENIDFYFMCGAYETIRDWFEERAKVKPKSVIMTGLNTAFTDSVSIIWYEAEEHDKEDSIRMFERLNIGRIPLTSAELVKAMFLSEAAKGSLAASRQEEIALQWDDMERELHRPSFWSFLSNDEGGGYGTRIDLVLDLIAKKDADSREKYQTFFTFAKWREEGSRPLEKIWEEIYRTFLLLLDWYEDHDLYHKIGYLIASGAETLGSIYAAWEGKGKQAFQDALDAMIRKSIELGNDREYGDLSYDRRDDYALISRLLLLFNVESVRQIRTSRFPFGKFKQKDGRSGWSLEHIHAQQSEGMTKQETWKKWLEYHKESIKAVGGPSELVEAIEKASEKNKLSREEFEALHQQAMDLLSSAGSTEYVHSIANLALLDASDNAALSNSAFDVKRNKIVKMDKEGRFIPFCTKMVFLKYYSPSDKTDLHFWGENDRKAYVREMKKVLTPYLPKEAAAEKEMA